MEAIFKASPTGNQAYFLPRDNMIATWEAWQRLHVSSSLRAVDFPRRHPHVHVCMLVQESLRLAHLPPPPAAPLTPLLSPSGEGRSSKPHPEGPQFSEEDLSDMQSDDEDDQLSRLLQVSVFPGLAVQQDQDLCVLSPAKCGLLLHHQRSSPLDRGRDCLGNKLRNLGIRTSKIRKAGKRVLRQLLPVLQVLPDASSAGGRSLPPSLLFTPASHTAWRRRSSSDTSLAAACQLTSPQGAREGAGPLRMQRAMSASMVRPPVHSLLAATPPAGRPAAHTPAAECSTKAENLFASVRSRVEGISVYTGPFR